MAYNPGPTHSACLDVMYSISHDDHPSAFCDVGRPVDGRRDTPSVQLGIRLTLAFKVTGSPAVLSSAVRGRNRD